MGFLFSVLFMYLCVFLLLVSYALMCKRGQGVSSTCDGGFRVLFLSNLAPGITR